MNYNNSNVYETVLPGDLCEVDCETKSRTILDNVKETTELLHGIETRLNEIRQLLWIKTEDTEKDIDIMDMDSNLVHNRDVAARIFKKINDMASRIGC